MFTRAAPRLGKSSPHRLILSCLITRDPASTNLVRFGKLVGNTVTGVTRGYRRIHGYRLISTRPKVRPSRREDRQGLPGPHFPFACVHMVWVWQDESFTARTSRIKACHCAAVCNNQL